MAEAFPRVTNIAVFGQTEMSPVTCALDGEDALRKIGSVGHAGEHGRRCGSSTST